MPSVHMHSTKQTDLTEASQDAELSRTANRNFAVSASLRATAWALAEAGLRAFRPELTEDQVQREVRAQFRRASG